MSDVPPSNDKKPGRFSAPKFGSLPAWIVLGLLLMSLPFFVSQSIIDNFRDAHSRNAWLLLKEYWPAWFAWPQWILFFWIVYNLVAWANNRAWKRNNSARRLPILSIPFFILASLAVLAYCAHGSAYLNKFYAPRGHYSLAPSTLKPLQKIPEVDDYLDPLEKYETAAKAMPSRSKKQGQLWAIRDVVSKNFKPFSYHYSGGRYNNVEMKYRLRLPEKLESGKKYPLLIWLHGVGESGDDNISQLSHMEPLIPFIDGPTQKDFFILVTQCPKDNSHWGRSSTDEGKGDAPMTIAMEILDET